MNAIEKDILRQHIATLSGKIEATNNSLNLLRKSQSAIRLSDTVAFLEVSLQNYITEISEQIKKL